MSFLDRIRNAFKEELPEEELTFEETMSRLEDFRKKSLEDTAERAYERVSYILDEVESLLSLVKELEKANPEGIQPGPKAVKERFCSTAKKQLESLEKPEKNIDSIRDFINKAYSIIHNLGGLTERQGMHVKFFFHEDFKPLGKKAKELSATVDETRRLLMDDPAYIKIANLSKQMEELGKARAEKSSKIPVIKNGIERVEDEIQRISKEIEGIDIKGFDSCRKDIEALEKKKGIISQKITSMLSIEKLLKKLVHERGGSELLVKYIESPLEALLKDNEMRIKDFVRQALELAEKGMDIDEKKMKKANDIINTEQLETEKANLVRANQELESKRSYLENDIMPRIERKKKLEEEQKRLEDDARKMKGTLEQLPKDISSIEKQKEDLRKKIAEEAARVMGTRIRLKL